jgi:hypothetical protein
LCPYSSSYSVYKYIPASILAGLVEGKEINIEKQVSLIVVATSNKDLDVILKTPKVCQIDTLFRINLKLLELSVKRIINGVNANQI